MQLAPFLAPRSVAILGASSDPARITGRPLAHLRARGYAGAIYPVNPSRSEIDGLPCYPDAAALPEAADLALILVPAAAVEAALESCARRGIGAAVVFSSGFGEAGQAGRAAESRLAQIAAGSGMRLLGPNCLGVVSPRSRLVLSFGGAFERLALEPGPVGLVSQSGALGGTILALAESRGVAASALFTTGNEADLTAAEVLDALVDDAETRFIGLFLEGARDGARFRRAIERAREASKPVVVLKVGRSREGARAAASHTGSLVGSDRVFDAVLRRAGAVRVDDLEELVETLRLLSRGCRPRAPSVGIVTPSGGQAGLLADRARAHGLLLPEPEPRTVEALRRALPEFGAAQNPLDVTGMVINQPLLFNQAVEAFAADARFGAVVLGLNHVPAERALAFAERIGPVCRASAAPIVAVWSTTDENAAAIARLEESGASVCRGSHLALAVLRRLAGLADPPPAGRGLSPDPARAAALREDLRARRRTGARTLGEHDSARLLARYGIRTAPARLVGSGAEARQAAEEIGFPVVVKVASPDLAHKTEAGAVRLGLDSPAAVERARAEVLAAVAERAPGARVDGVLVQRMVSGVELLAGVSRDPQFGPVVTVGLGGIWVEALADTTLRSVPLTDAEAAAMLGELRGARLLEGWRGSPPADVGAVVEVLLGLSLLAEEAGAAVESVDVNPLVVGARGQGCWAADALVVLGEAA